MTPLTSAMLLSSRIAIMATLVAALVAIPLSFLLARRSFAGKSLLETLFIVPLVLPPTVVGYLLIVLLGRNSSVGWLIEWAFGSGILFTISGAVVACSVVAFPLLYLPCKAAFASIETELEDIARLMGASRLQIFWHVSLPIARRGIGSGMLLAFARSLGEFGATLMVFGSREGRKTLPILVYDLAYESSNASLAIPAVILLTATSLLVVFLYNRATVSDD